MSSVPAVLTLNTHDGFVQLDTKRRVPQITRLSVDAWVFPWDRRPDLDRGFPRIKSFKAVFDTGAELTVIPRPLLELMVRQMHSTSEQPSQRVIEYGVDRHYVSGGDVDIRVGSGVKLAFKTRWVHLFFRARLADHPERFRGFTTPRTPNLDSPHPVRCAIADRGQEILLGMDIIHHWRVELDGRDQHYEIGIPHECL